MRTFGCCIAIALAAAGCGGPARDPDRDPAPPQPAVPLANDATGGKAHVLDIGDVEARIHVAGTLDEASRAENIEADEYTTPKGDLNMTTVTVKPPFPEQLQVRFSLKGNQRFAERPVALKGAVYRNKERVKEISAVYADPADAPSFVFNALEGLETLPDSLLLHVRLQGVLMPKGTDPASVKPAEAAYTAEAAAHLISNPIRINFIQETPGS